MEILYITFRLRASWCKSLKDKRSVVKAIITELRKHSLSVCETGEQNIVQYIEISASAIVANRAQGDSIAQRAEFYVSGSTDAELYQTFYEYR